MNGRFDAEKQLQELIGRYPEELAKHGIEVEISGVLLDYLGRSGQNIEDLLRRYPSLYKSMFAAGQPPDSTLTLLKALLNDDAARNRARRASIRHSLRELTGLIERIDNECQSRTSPRSSSAADTLANHRVDGVVWQLSDIHFGRLNTLNLNAEDLAHALYTIVRSTPEFEPRLIIVSGDMSSSADPDELKEFIHFCEVLSRLIWDEHRAYRFLVIPGNHETTWLNDGTADRLNNFKKFVADSGKVVTPFWSGTKIHSDSDGEVSVHRFDAEESQDAPPFVFVRDKRLDLRILLLVSPYYSGFVPSAVREVLGMIQQGHERDYLRDLLREDTGEFSRTYISQIKSNVWEHESTTIGVTHHNLSQYGQDICQNPNTKTLLSTLAEKGIQLILHGHTHLVEDRTVERRSSRGEAYPVPCPSLCGIPAPGNTHGFMMHLIGPVAQPRRVTSVVWSIDESRNFTRHPSHLYVRYRFLVHKDSLQVEHVRRRKQQRQQSEPT